MTFLISSQYNEKTMKIAIMTSSEAQQKYLEKRYPQQQTYAAMYSSWLGGIIKDPGLMLVPVDDHLVHRGDGVFEAIKCVEGRVYLLEEHLDRLESSAAKIFLKLPMPRAELREILLETLRVSGLKDAIVRLFLSRGPGNFSTNPADSVGEQIYLIVTTLKALAEEKYQKGVRVGRSHIPPKEAWLARIKTCNYLPNVMMKKEAVDQGLDFTVGFDSENRLTEGSTENMILLTREGKLVHPSLEGILAGTTMKRVFELAAQVPAVRGVETRAISFAEISQAAEVMMVGTTLDVLPVSEFAGTAIGTGSAGPVAKRLRELLVEDIHARGVAV